jgi:pyruvate formate lyase activating enzyme
VQVHNSNSRESTAYAGALVKTSLVDYPGKVACAVFLRGCNLRCPYCYNAALVTGNVNEENAATAAEIIAHLVKRKNVLTGFVLSGGEPLLSPVAAELVSAARRLGYFIKLDTNGTLPDVLELFLRNTTTKPDYIALDVKTAPARYALFSPAPVVERVSAEHYSTPIKNFQSELEHTISIISSLAPGAREFRTVLVPGLVDEDDIRALAHMLPKDAAWFFAPFKPGGCLDPSYNEITPYTESRMQQLVSLAREIIPGAQLR